MYNEHITSLQTDELTFGSDHLGLVHSDKEFTPSPKQEKNKKSVSNSPPRPMSGGITIGTSSKFDRLRMSMGMQKCGASSSTRLQPQLTSSSLELTPVLGTASDMRGIFANVMTGLEELRQDKTK